MDSELRDVLINIIDIVDYALNEIERDCKPDLTWEKQKLRELTRKVYDIE